MKTVHRQNHFSSSLSLYIRVAARPISFQYAHLLTFQTPLRVTYVPEPVLCCMCVGVCILHCIA